MQFSKPDSARSITAVACSVLNHYHISPPNPSDPALAIPEEGALQRGGPGA